VPSSATPCGSPSSMSAAARSWRACAYRSVSPARSA
jgi:hypothetical protein